MNQILGNQLLTPLQPGPWSDPIPKVKWRTLAIVAVIHAAVVTLLWALEVAAK